MLPHYVEPVYRPPSEARSLILQVTNGCSWNRCTFCEMYTQPQKRFDHKPLEAIEEELVQVARSGLSVRRIFLADGDAMTLSIRRLTGILEAIRRHLPGVERVSSYCLPRNLRHKSADELRALAELGLTLFYVGCESGDDEVLRCVNKGETFESSLAALEVIKAAGARSSVMILNGLGGKAFSEQHAVNSALLMNAPTGDSALLGGVDGIRCCSEIPSGCLPSVMAAIFSSQRLRRSVGSSARACCRKPMAASLPAGSS